MAVIAATLDSLAMSDGKNGYYFLRDIQVMICDHLDCLNGGVGLWSTTDMITNHEWYHRLFSFLAQHKGACYRIASDHFLWGMLPKIRKIADDILDIARLYGVPCWDDSALWARIQ